MEFKQFKKAFQNNFRKISKDSTHLFEVEVDKEELWNLYLDSFSEGTNEIEIFGEKREYDCSCCRNFIRNFVNVVVIDDNNEVKTVWDFETNSTFQPVVDALDSFIKSKTVTNVYVSKFAKIGVNKNHEQLEDGTILTWEHFYIKLDNKFITRTNESIESIQGDLRTTKDVFKRSLEEISKDSLEIVLELISQNSLYRGDQWEAILSSFLEFKRKYNDFSSEKEKDNYAWRKSVKAGGSVGRIRNHSIGTLLTNISEGMPLDTAVSKYEAIVAPSNYKRPKVIYTKRMLKQAKEKVEELGYLDSLTRRHATLDDITVNNILFANRDSSKRINGNPLDVFEEMAKDIVINPKKFSRVEEMSINDFIENVLPMAKEIEVLLENRHSKNLVSLIAPVNKEAKSMFKWNNPFSWAYAGNLTDSSMKQNVKNAGGNVEGELRFSIQWNDIEPDGNDLDAHCIEPSGNHINFNRKNNRMTTGELDVDIINPTKEKDAVENITWTDRSKMQDGIYKFFVHNYSHNGGRSGFRAQIEFDGQIYDFEYSKELRQEERVQVAEVKFENGKFTIDEKLPSSVSVKEIWNLNTNQFAPVSLMMFSPNYWDEQQGIGHKHYFFMLKDCVNSEKPNGFYNEFLKNDLREHRKVFEALGSKMAVEEAKDQLSGIGFSLTKRNDVIIKVKGNFERVLKIKF